MGAGSSTDPLKTIILVPDLEFIGANGVAEPKILKRKLWVSPPF